MTPPPRLWLLRHAAPLAAQARAGLCYGALDLPADPAATQAAARRMLPHLPRPLRVYSSSLQRCELLAQDLQALEPNLAYTLDPRLCELNFGTWEGQSWDSIARADIDAWAADLAHHRPGGGEPLVALLARVHAALAECAALGQDTLWITHAGVMRCVDWLQQHGTQATPQSGLWPRHAPAFGEWMERPLTVRNV